MHFFRLQLAKILSGDINPKVIEAGPALAGVKL